MKTGQVKLVSPLPVPIKLSEKTATLVRITAGPKIVVDRTYGNYTIMPCKPGERFTIMKIRAARCVAGTKDSRKEWEVTADEIAEDLAMDCNTYIWGIGADVTGEIITGSDDDPTVQIVRGFNGVFVADGEEPTEEELEKAEELLATSDQILIERGHEDWGSFKEPRSIHEGFRRAAKRMGVQADWLYRVLNTPLCPHCGAKLLTATATVCATCHRDVVPANGPERPEQEEVTAGAAKGPKRKKAAA
jgi:hypothetical protein